MNKKKIWIVSELFYPEESTTAYILTEIAKTLSSEFEVHAIAGTPVYEINNPIQELNNVEIHRIKSKKIDKNNLVFRLQRALTLCFCMKKFIKKYVTQHDYILMVTNPVFNTLFLPKFLKKRKIDTTLLVNDIFPENALEAGILKSGCIYSFIKRLFDSSYSSVSRCIVLGKDMAEIIKNKTKSHVPVLVIENWADTKRIQPNEKTNYQNKIVIKFSGNIGRVQGLEDLFHIINQVTNKKLLFIFAGKGAVLNKLKQIKEELRLENIVFEDAYPKEKEYEVLNDCDISLISLGKSMYGLGVPSKAYNCMSVGKPLLFVGPRNSEIYSEISDNNLGWSFSPDDKELVSFFNKLDSQDGKFQNYGLNARKCAETKYAKEIILEKYKEVFLGVSK